MTLDLEFVRHQFPALGDAPLRSVSYLDNAHASFPCRHTLWRLNRYHRERRFDPRLSLRLSSHGVDEVIGARRRLAQMLNVRPDDLYFGPSTSAVARTIAQRIVDQHRPGDEIIVSECCSPEFARPFTALGHKGIVVRTWAMDDGQNAHSLDSLTELLSDRVRAVIFPHQSPLFGQLHDLKAITSCARRSGAISIVEGSDYAALGFPNLAEISADIYHMAMERSFGPRLSTIALRAEAKAFLPPHQGRDPLMWLDRLVPGTVDPAHAAAVAGVADYFDAMYQHHAHGSRDAKGRVAEVRAMFGQHIARLRAQILDRLSSRSDVQALLGENSLGPTLAFTTAWPAQDLAQQLEHRGVVVSYGRYGMDKCLKRMGVPDESDVIRLGMQHYTSHDDIDRLLDGLSSLLR